MSKAQGPGTYSDGDFELVFRRLMDTSGGDEVAKLLNDEPLTHEPSFHLLLRQRALQVQSDKNVPPGLAQRFLPRHDMLFAFLHMRLHAALAEADRRAFSEGPPNVRPLPASQSPSPLAPALLVAIAAACEGASTLPAAKGPTHRLPEDVPALHRELAGLLSPKLASSLAATPWAPVNGSLFGLIRMRCLVCGTSRLAVHAWALEARVQPKWPQEIVARRLHASACRQCGHENAFAERIWAAQTPTPVDPLAILSCVLRLSDRERVYMPPGGARRLPKFDRVMEARLEILGRELGPTWQYESNLGTGIYADGVAYGGEDLRRRLEQLRDRALKR